MARLWKNITMKTESTKTPSTTTEKHPKVSEGATQGIKQLKNIPERTNSPAVFKLSF